MRRILILEDDNVMRMHLCNLIDDLNKDVEVFTASNLKDAYEIAMEYQIHLFLVDLILDPSNPSDASGYSFIQNIRDMRSYEYVPIIIITSLEDPKLFSYSHLKCYSYIEKKFDDEVVKKNILKALGAPIAFEQERKIFFKKEGIAYALEIQNIYYIDIKRRQLTVYSKNSKTEIPYKTAKAIIKELGSPLFVQCSRYNIINKSCVEYVDYTRRFVKLKGIKEPIEIGATMVKKFRDEMNGICTC